MPKLLLLILTGAAVLFLLESFRERRTLSADQYRVEKGPGKAWKVRREPSAAEKAEGAFRILFLSDLHGVRFGAGNERLIRRLRELRPDAVLLGGDMVTCGAKEELPDTGALIELLRGLSGCCPVYYGFGNHELRFRTRYPEDFAAFSAELSKEGVVFLDNESTGLKKAGAEGGLPFCLFAVTLPRAYYKKYRPGFGKKEPMPERFLMETLGPADARALNILLIHSPLYLKEAASWGADLVLSGHMHGGTVRLPDGNGLMTPQYQFLVKECSGLHREGSAAMIVTRGLGTHSVNLRINDLPEITVIDVEERMT